jgi:hypothetical protein
MCKNNKLILATIILFFSIFQVKINKIFASPPAPAPRCYIEGVIQEVIHMDASSDSTTGGLTDRATDIPERYVLKVNINKTSYVDGEKSFQSCDSLYPLGATKEIVINKDKIINNTIPIVKQKIIGTVSSFWWPSFDNYTVTSASKIANTTSFFEKIKAFIIQIGQYFRF